MKLLFMGVLVLLCTVFYAQTTSSEIKGFVTDTKKDGIPGAEVKILHEPTGTIYRIKSDVNGSFYLPQLLPGGPYSIVVKYPTFEELTELNIQLALGEVKEFNFELKEISRELQTIEVKANKNELLNDKKKGSEITISADQINKLPTIHRGIQDATRLSPQNSGNSFGGSNYRLNNLNIDGTANNDAFGFQEPGVGAGGSTAGGSPGSLARTQPISLDAVGEIQVALSPYDVKLGNFTGASINVVTKSGTNDFKASVYSFGRNQDITGKSVDEKRSKIANYYDIQSGFRAGGAFKKNKLFYFVNAEIGRRLEPVLYAPSSDGSAFNYGEIKAFADTLKNRYQYDVGSFDDINIKTLNNKFFMRLDWNINEKNQMIIRNNLVDAKADHLLRAPTILNLGSQAYTHNSINNSTVIELKTRVKPSVFNNLVLGFSSLHDHRTTNGDIFPHIEIIYNTNSTIFAGTYREAAVFQMKQKTIELSDNLTIYKNKHKLTLGTHNEIYLFDYHFVTPYNGRWAYKSLADFYANKPSRIRGTYHLENDDYDYNYNRPSADFDVLLSSVYLQDDYALSKKINLSFGLRLDGNFFCTKQNTNEDVRKYYQFESYTRGVKNQLIVAPRLGFSYDVLGDKTFKIRGGTGIFSGRMPFAWAAYSYIYNGNQFGNIDYKPSGEVALITTNFQDLANLQTGRKEINLVDSDFKLPRVWRSSLATDLKLPYGFVLTLEGVYTKTMYDALFQTLNLKDSTTTISGNGNDQRPVYLGSGNGQLVNPNYTSVFLLSNTSKGYRYSFSASLSKTFAHVANLFIAYNYGLSKDMMNGVRVSPQANWEWNQTNNPNAPSLSFSNFDIRHRIITALDLTKNWKKSKTILSFVFATQSGSPFSFIYSGDLNRDGSPTNDLFFVPASASEINLVDIKDANGNITVTKEKQWEQLEAYIASNDYLQSRRGQTTERNGARTPWNSQLDVKIAHELQITIKKKKHSLELSADIINLTNLLNKRWGYQNFVQNTTNSGYSLVKVTAVDASGKASFQFNNPSTTPWQVDPIASRWQMQIGLRYSF